LSTDICLSSVTAVFAGEPGLASFIEAKDDGSGGDNWSCKLCKAPVKSSPPTNQLFTARMPFLSPNQQCRSTNGKNITFHRLAHSELDWRSSSFGPLKASGYLGEGCHASHQPSDVSTPALSADKML